jgi:hypothetical protein
LDLVKHKKAQVTIEGILVSFLAILIALSFFNLNWERFYLAREVGEAGEIKMVGELLAQGINNVYANGEGFSLYLPPEVLNYSRLRAPEAMTGLGLSSITIDTSSRKIILSKSMAKTGGNEWNTSVAIIPVNITRLDPTPRFKETTIYNNGSWVVVYAYSENIRVV